MPGSGLGEVWEHYQILNTTNLKRHVTCIYCNKEYKYGSAPRLKVHLVKCQHCPEEAKMKFKQQRPIQREVMIREREQTPIRTSLGTASGNNDDAGTAQILPSTSASSMNLSENYTSESLNNSIINIDEKLVRAMYSSGVSLSMLESKYWKEALNAANVHIPSRHNISNPLLEAEYNRVRVGINHLLDNSRALALITDGWTNVNRKSVINFILTTPQPIFLKSVYPETQRCTSEYLGQQIINVIEEIGNTKFVAVITDNAANMKAAWRVVKNKYPHISCVGCASHTFNLLCKDIMKIRTCKQIHEKAVNIIKHIIHKATILANFEKIQTEKYGRIKCTLKLPSATRWSGEVMCLDSLRVNKEALQNLAITNILNVEIRELLLDESFWIELDEVVSVLQPISDAIKQSESDSATLSDVPAMFTNLQISIRRAMETIVSLTIEDKNKIKQAITNRKQFCIDPIHLAANYLDPRYRGEHLGTSVPAAVEFIGEYATFVHNGNEEKVAEVIENALQFKVKDGYYGQTNYMWKQFRLTNPSQWWQAFAPQEILAPIAIRLLSVPPSSAASERNWSMFGNTHTDKRNRLDRERLEKLIYIRANLRFMDDPRADISNDDITTPSITSMDDVDESMSTDEHDDDDSLNVVVNDDEDSLNVVPNFGLTNEDIDTLNNL